jgi:hypothetical protein
MHSNKHRPWTWLALAAGWSGGNILLGMQGTAPPPPQQTARAVRAAVLSAVSRPAAAERAARLRRCIDDSMRIGDRHARRALMEARQWQIIPQYRQ